MFIYLKDMNKHIKFRFLFRPICTFMYIHLATRKMIHAYSLATGLDYVELNWTRPRFLPESYQLKYKCAVKVTSNYRDVNKIYITGSTKNLTSDSISFRICNLRPGSICTLILLAVYNPASIDSGVVITGNTLDEQPSKRNSCLSDLIRTFGYFSC